MRTEFHAEIDHLTAELGEMCALAATLMTCATAALVHADDDAAVRVGVELARLARLRHCAEERAFAMLALQAPVAHDLRVVMSAFPIAADADRMGGLAANITKLRRRGTAVPAVALGVLAEMGGHGVRLAERAQFAVLGHDVVAAQNITAGDEAMNDLHRRLFTLVLDDRWEHGPIAAANVMLLGRFYERFADHAVSIARRVVFQVSGHLPQLSTTPT